MLRRDPHGCEAKERERDREREADKQAQPEREVKKAKTSHEDTTNTVTCFISRLFPHTHTYMPPSIKSSQHYMGQINDNQQQIPTYKPPGPNLPIFFQTAPPRTAA